MANWSLGPTRENLHGHFSRDLPPVLTIESGDTVTYQTLDSGWNYVPRRFPDIGAEKFAPINPALDSGHCLTGPIFVNDAEPGMTLEIKIIEVKPASYGWTVAGGWPHAVNKRFGFEDGIDAQLFWTLDAERMTGRNQFGHEISLHPFMGVMGLAPAEPGHHSTVPPRLVGGNIDCKELTSGTSLFLPIEVTGGLFSVGDGHASQGDGEVSVTAIECPMERVVLSFELHDSMQIPTPRARLNGAWATLGFASTLDEACFIALESMVDIMAQTYGLDRRNALALASTVVDMRITQIANQTLGVHAVLRDEAVRQLPA